jgi:L-ascorbate metabolism protein UlaG (beta-lactamase superfamily)
MPLLSLFARCALLLLPVLVLFGLPPEARCQASVPPPPDADEYTLTLPAGRVPAPPNAGSVEFIGSATVLIRYQGLTILTDPNFLPRGERAHLGYGTSSKRLADPAIAFSALPPIDLVILSHMHGDHFDELVQERLRRDVPIVTTPEASAQLEHLGFRQRYALRRWDSLTVSKGKARLRIAAMPARHGPPGATLLLPTVMGAMLDFEESEAGAAYRIYISGDTVLFDDIAEIAQRFPDIDLALLHLGGERLLGMIKATMNGADGARMLQLLGAHRAIPVHLDDYGMYKSPPSDFELAVGKAGLQDRVIYLRRGTAYGFSHARK